jgi:large subunit ribosomal protein L15
MKLHELRPPKGCRKKRKRLGKGPASGYGGTCGKGTKGQSCRSGSKVYPWFEGGQMPLQRRIPKRGMKPRKRTRFQIVNVNDLNRFKDNSIVDIIQLKKKGVVNKRSLPVKILGDGSLKKKLTVKANSFSKSAKEKIVALGGEIEIINVRENT